MEETDLWQVSDIYPESPCSTKLDLPWAFWSTMPLASSFRQLFQEAIFFFRKRVTPLFFFFLLSCLIF